MLVLMVSWVWAASVDVPAPFDSLQPQQTYAVDVIAHPVTTSGSSLISLANGSSKFRYNLNAAYFPLDGGGDGLMVRVCNCSWHSAPQPHCSDGWPFRASWGSVAAVTRKPGSDWEYNALNYSSIVVDGAADPRITRREKDGVYYMTADLLGCHTVSGQKMKACTHVFTSKTPLVKSSWKDNGMMANTCAKCNGGASILIRDDVPGSVHYAFLGTSDTASGLAYATSDDLLNWTYQGSWQGGRPGKWDSNGLAVGPQPMRLSTGDYIMFYNTDNGVGSKVRCRVGWMVLDKDDPLKVIARSDDPLLVPSLPWEEQGNTPSVIFADGLMAAGNDEFVVFYGAADTVVGAAKVRVVPSATSLSAIVVSLI